MRDWFVAVRLNGRLYRLESIQKNVSLSFIRCLLKWSVNKLRKLILLLMFSMRMSVWNIRLKGFYYIVVMCTYTDLQMVLKICAILSIFKYKYFVFTIISPTYQVWYLISSWTEWLYVFIYLNSIAVLTYVLIVCWKCTGCLCYVMFDCGEWKIKLNTMELYSWCLDLVTARCDVGTSD